jgi:glycosyltransferase involved in cell wall biosynthesis
MNHVAMMIPGIDRLGGAERQVMHLACGLRRRGWLVTLIALSGSGGDASRELMASGVGFLSLKMHKGLADPAGWLRLRNWIRANRPDILHGHLPHAAWMARWSRVTAPVRVVVDTIHTSSCGTLGRQLGYRCSNWLTDGVSAVSHGAADAYTNARMVADERLAVIPNGVDVRRWTSTPSDRSAFRAALGIRDEFLWVAAGRLEAVKNFSVLLEAFERLGHAARLVIVGSGSMKAELQARSAGLGLTGRVIFPGFDRDLLRWMQAADAFVLPSRWEGLPMVLLEAGACSLPSVATDIPGSRDVVQHGRTGLLARPGSAVALAEAMNALMRLAPAARAVLGHNARLHIEARFDLDMIVDQWADFYRQLLSQRSTTAGWGRLPKRRSVSDASVAFHHDPPQCESRIDALRETELLGSEFCDHFVK